MARKKRIDEWWRLPVAWLARWRALDAVTRRRWLLALAFLSSALVVFTVTWQISAEFARSGWQQGRDEDLYCLARNVYHEARGEPFAGQIAVAEVTMNRVASRRFPDTVCAVVYEKRFDSRRNRLVGAFSWTEFDELARPEGRSWRRAQRAAEAVYDGQREPTVEGALFYHADRIQPAWAVQKRQVTQIGNHIFYE